MKKGDMLTYYRPCDCGPRVTAKTPMHLSPYITPLTMTPLATCLKVLSAAACYRVCRRYSTNSWIMFGLKLPPDLNLS